MLSSNVRKVLYSPACVQVLFPCNVKHSLMAYRLYKQECMPFLCHAQNLSAVIFTVYPVVSFKPSRIRHKLTR